MVQPEDPRRLLDELLRRDFSAFLRKAWPSISGGELLKWNWHLDALCHALDRVARGECQRLIINLPPRNGKSKTVSSIWPAWLLGRNPATNIVGVSYSNDLSAKLARECSTLMQMPWYRELFPRAIISHKRSMASDFEMIGGGGRLGTSVTGTLTGRGGDIIILDDVIKPEDATTEHAREAVKEWFRSTLASRLNDKSTGAIILVMQRLHQDDLSGVLLEAGGWEHLNLPAIAVTDETVQLTRGRTYFRRAGEVLHPAREPIEELERQKDLMGSIVFAAQYQQEPVPATGNLIDAAWLRSYDPASLDRRGGRIVQSWDTASKDNPHNDWSVCITALLKDKKVYVLEVFRKRLKFPELKANAVLMARAHETRALLIEDQSSGTQLIQTLRAENLRGVPDPIARRVEQDKVARVAGVSAMIEAGQLLLPHEAPWVADFQSELLGFPNARHDDQVDALSQLLAWVRDRDRFEPDDETHGPVIVRAA